MRKLIIALAAIAAMNQAQAAEDDPITTIVQETCALCHGEQGEASSSIYPRLAGQNRDYLAKQLRNFRDGSRKSDTMNDMAKELKDEEIAGLASYFAAQPVLSHRIASIKKPLNAVGYYIYHKGNKFADIPPCASCHGELGEGDENLPRLAGQHKRYVAAQLDAFHERKRTNDNQIMRSIAKRLTKLEIEAVSLYVSGLKPQPKP
ncbi:MAG: cytochrome c, class I [Hyphomicrobiales bacterium]|nr:MAG: cytochrome c, class I [Hyphomicrobiales bacterium]